MKIKNVFLALALIGISVGLFASTENGPTNGKGKQSKEEDALYCKKSATIDGVTYTVECWMCKCNDLEFPTGDSTPTP
jgi:hypothetical protein